MPHELGNGLEWHTLTHEERSVRVAEIVRPKVTDASFLHARMELLRHRVPVERRSIIRIEYQPACEPGFLSDPATFH